MATVGIKALTGIAAGVHIHHVTEGFDKSHPVSVVILPYPITIRYRLITSSTAEGVNQNRPTDHPRD